MLLHPSPVAGRSSDTLPPLPAYIKLPQGDITHAERTLQNPYAGKRSHRSGAQKAGLAYQSRVGRHLGDTCPATSVVSGPWFYYSDATRVRSYCQPDFLIRTLSGRALVVVEAKLRWTSDAWWQLRSLYLPVLRKAMLGETLLPLCICRSYDPAIRIPEPVNFVDEVDECKPGLFNVMVWKP
jgi:hypothetical protein